jgi:cation transport ATPase
MRIEGDGEREIPVEQLNTGMSVRVRSGDLIPADMRVIRGESACDESNLTGEARAVAKEVGDVALAGTVNLWGVLDGAVLRPASESALQKIIRLIEQAQEMKAPSQRFSDRFGTRYTWFVLVACLRFFLFGWLVARLAGICGHVRQYERVLPLDGAARRALALRARAQCSFRDPLGDRRRRAARRALPRRLCSRTYCRAACGRSR